MSMGRDYVSELRPTKDLCSSPRWYMSMESHDGMILTSESRRTWRETCPSATMSRHGLIRSRTQAPAVRGRRNFLFKRMIKIDCKLSEGRALAQAVTGLSPRRPGFAPGLIHVGFMVDKVALGQVFLRFLRFSPVNIIPPSLSKRISSGECVIC
jgi:hypothetical protein